MNSLCANLFHKGLKSKNKKKKKKKKKSAQMSKPWNSMWRQPDHRSDGCRQAASLP
jgi:hypothetical protein